MTKDKLNFYFILGIGILFIFAGPFAWWINLIIVMAVALCFLALLFFIIYAAASGIGYARQTEKEAWDYWEKMKVKKWEDFSEEEKMKMVSACSIINSDVGTVMTEQQIISALQEQLPIMAPHLGLTYSY